ncbi:arginine esterase-like [Cimex lectularius]|uniref:Peptidase S1 domain-containing protein n=1 Tax=Cimex lectularius TaxID=79782 RepID=A0A8I6SH83_CIMLE|nr:arginine esterase-like [Cimex lectularius]
MVDVIGIFSKSVHLGEYPYVVNIEAKRDRAHLCPATLITPSHAATSAGCITIWKNFTNDEDDVWHLRDCRDYAIHAGNNHLDKSNSKSQIQDVSFWWAHPRYRKSSTGIAKNDLALIHMDDDLEMNHFVRTLSLPSSFSTELFIKSLELYGKKCVVLGWLKKATCVDSTLDSNSLQIYQVQIIKDDACSKKICDHYNIRLCDLDVNKLGFFCADLLNRTDCFCDSDTGGPIVCDGNLAGFSTWMPKCKNNDKLPALFVNLEVLYEMEHHDFYSGKASISRASDLAVFIALITLHFFVIF